MNPGKATTPSGNVQDCPSDATACIEAELAPVFKCRPHGRRGSTFPDRVRTPSRVQEFNGYVPIESTDQLDQPGFSDFPAVKDLELRLAERDVKEELQPGDGGLDK